jgi:hypothetical protein
MAKIDTMHPADMDADQLRDEALRLLDIISAEFESDPMSVQLLRPSYRRAHQGRDRRAS